MAFLSRPSIVFMYASFAFFIWLFASGYVFEYSRLKSYQKALANRIEVINIKLEESKLVLTQMEDRDFIRRSAIENLGLVQESDLIFLFP